jgi:hypothetical protein
MDTRVPLKLSAGKQSSYTSTPKNNGAKYDDIIFEDWRAKGKRLLEQKPKTRDQSRLRRYIFRWSQSPTCLKFEDVERIKILLKNEGVREYIFQLEKNPNTGISHYQGYFRFDQAHSQRPNKIIANLSSSFDGIEVIPFTKGISLESVRCYCSKKDIRIAGPFIYSDNLMSFAT